MGDRSLLTKEWLIEQYVEKVLSKEEIASMCGYSRHNISKRLRDWGIARGEKKRYRSWNTGLTKETDERLKKISEERIGEGNPMHGKNVWNKGLTKETDERMQSISKKMSVREYSDETRERMRKAKLGLRGEKANNFKKGEYSDAAGYMIVSEGPSKRYAHRAVAEKILGRKLAKTEHVHHVDMNKENNSPENLLVMPNRAHGSLHKAMNNGLCGSGRKEQIKFLSSISASFSELV